MQPDPPEEGRPWKVPWPYGYPQAVDSAGSVAAPLLAGFSITLLGIAIASSTGMRWANEAMVALAAATGLLVFAVQAAFIARSFHVTPAELLGWWAEPDKNPGLAQLHQWQAEHKVNYDIWAARFRLSYNLGLVLLLAGVALCLVPPTVGRNTPRWVAFAMMTGTVVFEGLWICRDWLRQRASRD